MTKRRASPLATTIAGGQTMIELEKANDRLDDAEGAIYAFRQKHGMSVRAFSACVWKEACDLRKQHQEAMDEVHVCAEEHRQAIRRRLPTTNGGGTR